MSLVRSGLATIALVGMGCTLSPVGAFANYYLNSVVNNSSEPVSVSNTIQPGKAVQNRSFGWSYWGAMNIKGSALGDVKIYEDGSKCPGNSWAAIIEHGAQKWGFGYEGNGSIDITINADHSIKVAGNGHVVPGGCGATPTPTPQMATLTCWYRGDFSYFGYVTGGSGLHVGGSLHDPGADNEWQYGIIGTSGSDCPRRMPGR